MDGDVRSGECMPEAYSKELRNRIVQTYEVEEGGYTAIGIRFSVSAPTVFRWIRIYRSSGDITPSQRLVEHRRLSVPKTSRAGSTDWGSNRQ